MARRTRAGNVAQEDLFSSAGGHTSARLAGLSWPEQSRFPVNHSTAKVRTVLWPDVADSPAPLLVTGYSSLDELISVLWAWCQSGHPGPARLVLGNEPSPSTRARFGDPTEVLAVEVLDYWLEQGFSPRLHGPVVGLIDAITTGRVQVRVHTDPHRMLHAKVYVGAGAATVGSSNFSTRGLGAQTEANVRFDRSADPARYAETTQLAENLWTVGTDWGPGFIAVLRRLLVEVGWREALARAVADLLRGDWAADLLAENARSGRGLWPSQRAGIAQALWVLESCGGVLVADATGSGKTRMGARLTKAVRDRLIRTGRIRDGLVTLVAPPQAIDTWSAEAIGCGLNLQTVSHGVLSRDHALSVESVAGAQVLAADEAHNFLNDSKRTARVTTHQADHVLLFTATPISRGTADLAALVRLLGADNFDDTTIDALLQLSRGRSLTDAETRAVRDQLQRFTVRRTKRMLNELVDREPGAYRDADGRPCRYPTNDVHVYDTTDTDPDAAIATEIRALAARMRGVARIGRLAPDPRGQADDALVLRRRLAAARALAAHQVTEMMRSSRAALIQHVAGTPAALAFEDLPPLAGAVSGDMLATTATLPRPKVTLGCALPDWLADDAAWAAACAEDHQLYAQILDLAKRLSTARETGKAQLILDLHAGADRVLAFDSHPITLHKIGQLLDHLPGGDQARVVYGTGANTQGKRQVANLLARDSTARVIGLCSNSISEAVNLQGAAVLVHLDLPTTLRVAEQRVGRIDRMDSPHTTIQTWWPQDSPAFATRAAELLTARAADSAALLGSNLDLPTWDTTTPELVATELVTSDPVDTLAHVAGLQAEAETGDGIAHALQPVHDLVYGPDPLLPTDLYEQLSGATARVLARVSHVQSATAWGFFAVASAGHGAPRWILLEGQPGHPVYDQHTIVTRLRALLSDDPAPHSPDDTAQLLLGGYLDQINRAEPALLPRLHQAALAPDAHRAHRLAGNRPAPRHRHRRPVDRAAGPGRPHPQRVRPVHRGPTLARTRPPHPHHLHPADPQPAAPAARHHPPDDRPPDSPAPGRGTLHRPGPHHPRREPHHRRHPRHPPPPARQGGHRDYPTTTRPRGAGRTEPFLLQRRPGPLLQDPAASGHARSREPGRAGGPTQRRRGVRRTQPWSRPGPLATRHRGPRRAVVPDHRIRAAVAPGQRNLAAPVHRPCLKPTLPVAGGGPADQLREVQASYRRPGLQRVADPGAPAVRRRVPRTNMDGRPRRG